MLRAWPTVADAGSVELGSAALSSGPGISPCPFRHDRLVLLLVDGEEFESHKCPVCASFDGLSIRGNRESGILVIGNATATRKDGGIVQCQSCQSLVWWSIT
jgi:hypothetical protein